MYSVLILDTIFEEIEKQDWNESDAENERIISDVVFSQLLPIIENMLSFSIQRENIKEIVMTYSKQYNLPDEYNNFLLSALGMNTQA